MDTKTHYKGTDKNMQCRGFQYEVGKKYKAEGKIKLCGNGFHAFENPLDVWEFYPPGNNRFFEVEQGGEFDDDGMKTVSSEIKLKAEIYLVGLIKAGVHFILSKAKKNMATGDSGHAAATEDRGHAAATGYRGHAAATGYSGHAAATGDGGHAAATGARGHAAATGDEAIACVLGIKAKAMTVKGWIILIDWRYVNDKWIIKDIYHAKVGQKIKGVKIQPNTCYWFEGGKLKAKKSNSE